MIKPFLAGAALCGVLPAFAAASVVPDPNFESAALFDTNDATFTGMGASMSPMSSAAGTGDFHGAPSDDVSVPPLPEPATLAIVGAGVLGLIGVGWRRARR